MPKGHSLNVVIKVKEKFYRGQRGYLVYGTDQRGRKVSIFTTLHESAERMRQNIRCGREPDDDGWPPKERT